MKNNKNHIIILIVALIIIILIILLLTKPKKPSGISYKISYDGINCPTPYVVFYSDGTYNYYEYYSDYGEELTPKKGKYKYNISKLIENINNYEVDEMGPYTIEITNGKEYTAYSTNKELRELLEKNNIVLEKCMSREDE